MHGGPRANEAERSDESVACPWGVTVSASCCPRCTRCAAPRPEKKKSLRRTGREFVAGPKPQRCLQPWPPGTQILSMPGIEIRASLDVPDLGPMVDQHAERPRPWMPRKWPRSQHDCATWELGKLVRLGTPPSTSFTAHHARSAEISRSTRWLRSGAYLTGTGLRLMHEHLMDQVAL